MSFRWMAACSARLSSRPCSARWRATMSCSEELAAGLRRVVRIQHPVDRLGARPRCRRGVELAAREGGEVQRLERPRLPQAQRGDAMGAVAGHDEVEGVRLDRLGGQPAARARGALDPAAEADRIAHLGPLEEPVVAGLQPRVGLLDLAAVADRLAEHAELVAHAVAEGRHAEGRHRVEEAGRQPAEAAVAERRIGLVLEQVGQRALAADAFLRRRHEVERVERVGERPPHQELHRQVVDAARPAGEVLALGLAPAAGQFAAADRRQGAQPAGGGRRQYRRALGETEVTHDLLEQVVAGHRGVWHRCAEESVRIVGVGARRGCAGGLYPRKAMCRRSRAATWRARWRR